MANDAVAGTPEQLGQPPADDLLGHGGGRRGDVQARVLVPRRGEPVGRQRGGERAAEDEAEEARRLAGHEPGAGAGDERIEHRARVGRSLGQRPAERGAQGVGVGLRGPDAAVGQVVEVGRGVVGGGGQEVVAVHRPTLSGAPASQNSLNPGRHLIRWTAARALRARRPTPAMEPASLPVTKGRGSIEDPEVLENVPGHVIPILEREFDDFDTEVGQVPRGETRGDRVHRLPPQAGRLRPAPARRADDPRQAADGRHHARAAGGLRRRHRALRAAEQGPHHDAPEHPDAPRPAATTPPS